MEVLVIFGSESDKAVYSKLMEKLEDRGIESTLEICSAHREPERLIKILKKSDEKIVIAGAGLSAALPGFIASHSDKLVIGIPVNANYFGLDALLSIHQMPKGFAVLGTGVEAIEETVEAVVNKKESAHAKKHLKKKILLLKNKKKIPTMTMKQFTLTLLKSALLKQLTQKNN